MLLFLFKVKKNPINRISIIIIHHPSSFLYFFLLLLLLFLLLLFLLLSFFLSITKFLHTTALLLLLLYFFFFLNYCCYYRYSSLFLFTTYVHHANNSEVHPVFLQQYVVAPEIDIACSGISQHIFFITWTYHQESFASCQNIEEHLISLTIYSYTFNQL